MTRGILVTMPPAVSHPQLTSYFPTNIFNPTGSVLIEGVVVKIRAYRYSFHEEIKIYTAVAAIPGNIRGITILRSACTLVQPSISAASSKSLGTVSRKPVSIQTENGMAKVLWAKISPAKVLIKCKDLKIINKGIISNIFGNIVVSKTIIIRRYLIGKRKREKAYAARIEIKTANTVVAKAIIKLFKKYLGNFVNPNKDT